MIDPSIEELTKKIREKCEFRINRYGLVLAAAKAARIITDEQNAERKEIEKAIFASNDARDRGDKSVIKSEIRQPNDAPDEKMLQLAIQKIYDGEFLIISD